MVVWGIMLTKYGKYDILLYKPKIGHFRPLVLYLNKERGMNWAGLIFILALLVVTMGVSWHLQKLIDES